MNEVETIAELIEPKLKVGGCGVGKAVAIIY